MLEQTITHYFPWDDADTVAYCGHPMTAVDRHSPAPTCPACAVRQAAEELAFAETPEPLDAEEARTELDPLLNAGIPERPLSPLVAELFALATTLNRLALLRLLEEERAS